MKILDRFVLKAYVKPFIITFLVMVLFMLMQFVWKYIDDLVGRGVEWYYIAELLFYTSATVVPMSLPLAILLSSIMTFGTLGEHNEMAALKASGNSLIRVMRPVIGFILLVAIGAFFFSNYVIPVANLKSETLLKNITNKKPALNIREGVFYGGIEGYSIKVGEKFGENQSELRNVYVYDHSSKMGNMKVIVSETGKMEMTEDEMFLNIELFEGNSYEDIYPNKVEDRNNFPFVRSEFSRSLMRFNLSDFQSGDLRSGSRKDFDMLNIIQLEITTDSLRGVLKWRKEEFEESMIEKYSFIETELSDSTKAASSANISNNRRKDEQVDPEILKDDILSNIAPIEKSRVIQNALRIARSNKAYYDNTKTEYNWRHKLIARHLLEWHKKFSISFSCLVLFFIGAPLGAIIRKGGMGMPVVISVIIFLIYHVTSYSFEKLGRELLWTPFRAIWSANLMLFPIGIWLTYKSATDSAIFNIEIYLKPFRKISSIFAKSKKKS
ncbi:LptF/LptG family permease [Owenweeksia hongkongensis]|uniref:Putative permease n=1 Tax=Owenweeksia hongkongensis (strain DSM 17368 / CIP 108786 / JCM 12287 / NRRL B-23963 / UST20020801) TaxID=926562 RepID=G8R1J1_OWEHD|nr:LptF/LptG family permease [Owenweeksia hongkongensis]AEV31730.1 putative permease [Owenweeksia hongkongensis DSM 17368]